MVHLPTKLQTRVVVYCVLCLSSQVDASDSAFPQPASEDSWQFEALRGTDIGPIEFDAILELHSKYANTTTTLFVTYTVSQEAITYEIRWAEPAIGTLNFPVTPYGLNTSVSRTEFRLRYPATNTTELHQMPAGPRGVFDHVLNSYDVADSRYAVSESRSSRSHMRDLLASHNTATSDSKHLLSHRRSGPLIEDSTGVEWRPGDTQQRVLNRFLFRDATESVSHRAEIAPSSIQVGGFSVRYESSRGEDLEIVAVPATRNRGGRSVSVELRQTDVSGRKLLLPRLITVRHKSDQTVLRRSVVYRYRVPVDSATDQPAQTVAAFDWDSHEADRFRDTLARYWRANGASVPQKDKLWLADYVSRLRSLALARPTVPHAGNYYYCAIFNCMLDGRSNEELARLVMGYGSLYKSMGLHEVSASVVANILETFAERKRESVVQALVGVDWGPFFESCPTRALVRVLQQSRARNEYGLALLLAYLDRPVAVSVDPGCSEYYEILAASLAACAETQRLAAEKRDEGTDIILATLGWTGHKVVLVSDMYRQRASDIFQINDQKMNGM